MSSPALPLSDIVNIVVQIATQNPASPTFNVGIVIGPTAVIPGSQRTRTYTTTAQMLSDGFLISSPEYIAAQLYFSQSPALQQLVVGRQDSTSIATFSIPGGSTGTGFILGDVVAVVQGGGSGGQLTVSSIGGSGQITGLTFTPTTFGVGQGTGYAVANGLTLTGGHGSGATINILSIGDTALQAVTYCRSASTLWWACGVTSAATADHQAIAAFAQSIAPTMMYFYTTADAAALAGTAGNVFSYMKTNLYNRVFGIYSTTQAGLAPNNPYSWAAAMGVAMGLNTGLAGSYFTMFGKTLVGIAAEPLTQTQANTIAGFNAANGNNGNVYLNYGAFTMLTQGMVGSGQFMDEILNIDMLTSAMQFNVVGLLTSRPAVPMTDAGEQQLIHAVNNACQDAVSRGFIAPGVWQGVQIINLANGGDVPAGYLSQAYPYAKQSATARAARQAMPIYIAIIESQAAQSLLIGIYVQR